MSDERFLRSEMMLGKDALSKLSKAHVAVFGVGGVGGYVCEALARSGIGNIDIIDNDDVSESNINRQIIALTSTIGREKVDVMAERMRDINPAIKVTPVKCFYLPDTRSQFDFSAYDYVADAVDTVTAKIDIIMAAKEAGVPVISAMGAGNKLDPTAFRVADIYKTSVCPLARVMRHEMKKRGVDHLKVVYSTEIPVEAEREDKAGEKGREDRQGETDATGSNPDGGKFKKVAPGSTAFTPSVMGIIMASEIVKDLIKA